MMPEQNDQTVSYEGYRPGCLGEVVRLHALYYSKYWDFGLLFERQVAEGLSDFLNQFDERRDLFLTAWADNRMVGSISVQHDDKNEESAQIRWVILSEEAQGKGVGKTMMERAMEFIKKAGYRHARLGTFRGLNAARSLYERHGFKLIQERPSAYWGTTVQAQDFEWHNPLK
jgi:ribosomal protein S18 acetylase RimI-like enzyme